MIEPWQRTLIRSLFPYSSSKLSIEAAFIAKYPHVPNYLYKYRAFCDRHKEALEADQLWFSSPDRFNDPFDTTVYFDSARFLVEDESVDECLARVKEMLESGATASQSKPLQKPIRAGEWQLKMFAALENQFEEPFRTRLRDFIVERMARENQNMIQAMSDSFRSGFSVLSLSANPLSSLMWSHYSNSHRGFCIEYDFGDLLYSHVRKRLCFPVLYRAKRTDATRYLARAGDNFNNLFGQYLCLLKSSEWAYEREWRIVHAMGPECANEAMSMPPPSALVVGADAQNEDVSWARAFCERRGIPCKRMNKDLGRRALTITSDEVAA